MKKILILFIMSVAFNTIKAQNAEWGILYQRVSVEGKVRNLVEQTAFQTTSYTTTREVEGVGEMLGFYGAYFHPFLKFNDDMAIGAYGGAKFLFSLFAGSSEAYNLGIQIPVAAVFKYGSQATNESEGLFGFGAGAGVQVSAFNMEDPVETKVTGISPYVLVEITAIDRVALRFNYNILKFNTHYMSSSGRVPKLTFSTFGVDLAGILTF